MKNLILKLEHTNSVQESKEGLKINKIVSTISPQNFIKLLKDADNKVNPRIATVNKITKSIFETLETSPELFWFKSKGILLATEGCESLDRNRIRVSLENKEFEGIMDGGHNTFAIAIYLIYKLFGEKLKSWDECKKFWNENYEEILLKFEERASEFAFSIPIEIIYPNGQDGSIEEYYDFISEICSARNNNVQLKETAKGNQVGYYDFLKETLNDKFDIIWRTGDNGKINSEDVISLSTLPLIYLKNKELLPEDIKNLNKISIYSQKGKCVEFFNDVMAHTDISNEINGKFNLKNETIKSALELTADILYFFDRLYLGFPDLYHNASPGKFGRISAVNNNKKSKAPFGTTDSLCDYQYPYGFFYPLLCGITDLMQYDEISKKLQWRINPRTLDLNLLDLSQYVNIIKIVNFDPQKIGKSDFFYKEAENIFKNI